MFPSKTRPMISAFLLNTGEPELPPMMSLLEQKFIGVARLSFDLAAIQLLGRANGSFPVFRSKAPAMLVIGGTGFPFSIQPLTCPYETRGVKVASGYVLVPKISKFALAISS